MWNWKSLFNSKEVDEMKFLIAGLGNIGAEYGEGFTTVKEVGVKNLFNLM